MSSAGSNNVERLVRTVAAGDRGDPGDPRWSALLRLLTAAARGAAVDPEREQAAVIAYRAAADARPGRGVRPRRPGARARRHRPVRPARALAGGLAAVVALCGVGVAAAGAGVLPDRSHPAHSGPSPAPAVPTASSASTRAAADTTRPAPRTATAVPGAGADRGGSGAAGAAQERPRSGGPRSLPPTAVRALCRVYLAAVRDGRAPAGALTDRLRREAGGRERVAQYCRAVVSTGAEAK